MIKISKTKKVIGNDDVFVIAEIGKNFIQTAEERPIKEYLNNAKILVQEAKKAGADAVKFQTHDVEDEILPTNFTSPHFMTNGSDRLSWVTRNTKATPLKEFWLPLKEYCGTQDIIFMSTPMSRNAARKLASIDVPLWKIGSADIQDFTLLDYVISTGLPIIISCGMVSLLELQKVIKYICSKHIPLALLYCISKYPAPAETFNLSSIEYFIEQYPELIIGFSDHSIGVELPLSAVKIGAKIVEKHFTISRNMWGPDHKASAEPHEFKAMVDKIRTKDFRKINSLQYYGEKTRELDGAKNEFRPYFNKGLVANQDIQAGTMLDTHMIYAMRPKMLINGLGANKLHEIIGKKVTKNLKKYDPIQKICVK
jgi:sialic acid synthase SpsE